MEQQVILLLHKQNNYFFEKHCVSHLSLCQEPGDFTVYPLPGNFRENVFEEVRYRVVFLQHHSGSALYFLLNLKSSDELCQYNNYT